MPRADFRVGGSPENPLALVSQPHQFRWTLSLSSEGSVLSLRGSRGRSYLPTPQMVTQMDMQIVTWEESGPTVIYPGPCGTRELVAAKTQSEEEN